MKLTSALAFIITLGLLAGCQVGASVGANGSGMPAPGATASSTPSAAPSAAPSSAASPSAMPSDAPVPGGFVAQNVVPRIYDATGSQLAPMLFLAGCLLIAGVSIRVLVPRLAGW